MKTKSTFAKLLSLMLLALTFVPEMASAIALTSRSTTIGSSAASAVTTYGFSFKPGTSGNIGAIKLQICDSPLEAAGCVNSAGSAGASFTANGASLTGQTGISGFVTGSGTPPAPNANTFWITNSSPQNVSNSATVTISLTNVLNPSTANTEFYTRITTYSDSAGSAEVDYGAEALSTANQITVSGTMPESLVFCVGTSGSNCTNITGTAVNLGTFSPAVTSTGTSVMSASTNAGSGYAITINGTTMTSGSNAVTAMGTQSANSSGCAVSCTSTVGVSQFGSNVRANTTPSLGSDVSGTGTATGSGGYNTVNSFRFFTGDSVASVSGVTNSNLFTNSYIVNVDGAQPAGLYTSTMTYICTATF